MTYVLDAVVILIIGLSVWHGVRRGLVRTAVVLVGCLLALVLVAKVSDPIAAWTYDAWIEPLLEQSLVTQIQEAGELEVEIGLRSLFGDRAEGLVRQLAQQGIPASVTIELSDLSEATIRAQAAPAMETIVRPVVCNALSIAVAVVVFLALLLVVEWLAWLLNTIAKLPILKQVNQIGGLLIGILLGVLWTMVFVAVVRAGVDLGLFGTLVTDDTLEATTFIAFFKDMIR